MNMFRKNTTYKGLALAIALAAASGGVAAQDFVFGFNPRSGDVWVDTQLRDMNTYGYQLIGEDKVDSAIVVFQKNVKDYPKSWNVYDSLGEAYATKGDKKKAREQYNKALAMTKNPAQEKRITGEARAPAS